MNPLDVLKPNYMGDLLINKGIEELVQNRGLGVEEVSQANRQAIVQRLESNNPEVMKDRLRTAKAREFGKTKETVGF